MRINSDFKDLLSWFELEKVEYLLVGVCGHSSQ